MMIKKFLLAAVVITVINTVLVVFLTDKLNAQNSPVEHAVVFSYQGKLADAEGTPVSGSKAVTFRLWDAFTDGNLVWEDTYSVEVNEGMFNVLLGQESASPIYVNYIPDQGNLFIEVEIDGETLTPRELITPVPYAVHAYSLAHGTVGTEHLLDGSVTAAKIMPGEIIKTDFVEAQTSISTSSVDVIAMPGMQLEVETGANLLEINFGGGFNAEFVDPNQNAGQSQFLIKVDGEIVTRRSLVFPDSRPQDSIEITKYVTVEAGVHSIEVFWQTNWGPMAMKLINPGDSANRAYLAIKEFKV